MSLNRLVIEPGDQPVKTLCLHDIAALVVSHPQVTYSQAVLSKLMDAGGVFVSCSANRIPNGMLLPLSANRTQTERFAAQAAAPRPLYKRLWQQIVRAKINAQAETLRQTRGDDAGLAALVPLVKSGDPANVEARAARRYWTLLFSDRPFRRDFDAADDNQLLNYGYAVLRAIVARAICSSGLHPTIGLHHHNRYNPFCLADDLMEPLRPLVDIAAWRLSRAGPSACLDSATKKALINAICARYRIGDENRSLFDLMSQITASLSEIFLQRRGVLFLPTVQIPSGRD